MIVVKVNTTININKYYDMIITGTEDNPTYYYKPKTYPLKINNIILNGVVIKADNPHIIINKNNIKIAPYELDQEHIIEIDGLGSSNSIVDVFINIKDVFAVNKREISTILNISKRASN